MSEALYRLLTVALCITTSVSAPQNTKDNTSITYVKLDPDIQNQPVTTTSRESRIQNIPLTIPNIVKHTNQSANKSDGITSNYPDKVNSDIDAKKLNEDTTSQPEGKTQENVSNSYPDEIIFDNETRDNESLPDPKLDQSNNTEIIVDESRQTETITESLSDDNQTDHLGSESIQFDRRISDTTASYEEAITADDVLEEVTVNMEVDEEITKAPVPNVLPKLSHYGKSSFGSHSSNLIGRSGKRGFISKCKCEKIWNCVKLQISVHRCPDEYFLCC